MVPERKRWPEQRVMELTANATDSIRCAVNLAIKTGQDRSLFSDSFETTEYTGFVGALAFADDRTGGVVERHTDLWTRVPVRIDAG